MKNKANREPPFGTNERQSITSVHRQKSNSIILDGEYIDIHETNALEPYNLGVDDIPYIDEDWGKLQSKSKYLI